MSVPLARSPSTVPSNTTSPPAVPAPGLLGRWWGRYRQARHGREFPTPAAIVETLNREHPLKDLDDAIEEMVATVADLAAVTGLSWDTVKDIVKAHLERTRGHPRLKELRRAFVRLLPACQHEPGVVDAGGRGGAGCAACGTSHRE